jgi:hypothetical protein
MVIVMGGLALDKGMGATTTGAGAGADSALGVISNEL